MSQKQRVLILAAHEAPKPAGGELGFQQVERVTRFDEAIRKLSEGQFDGLFIEGARLQDAIRLGRWVDLIDVLENFPEGVAIVDQENVVVWANRQFRAWSAHLSQSSSQEVAGNNFYAAIGKPEILGPEFSPLNASRACGTVTCCTLRVPDNRYFQIHVAPLLNESVPPRYLVVAMRDITSEVQQQQKLDAIHKAGIELADIKPDEIAHLSVEERVEILKANILRYTQDLLHYDVVEIRLLDPRTGELLPLLAVGLTEESRQRRLFARTSDNGVTGYVAATGKSYLCEDTGEDPLYLEGLRGARSSLTVPLLLHDQVIGTFNVESPDPHAFTERDLQFLEMFSRDVALAIHTLELLETQQVDAAQRSLEAIHGAIAKPMDEILNDVVTTMDLITSKEHADPVLLERLRHVLENARNIKRLIHEIGQRMAPTTAMPAVAPAHQPSRLQGYRVLVVDAQEEVRHEAHRLLERHGCIVETCDTGTRALSMVRSCSAGELYDAILSDIRLPDMSGYELFVKLKEILGVVPMILMTGFGWDPGHTIVKARQAGLLPKAVLYKPFRPEQVLETIEMVAKSVPRAVAAKS
ncbi:MAG: two-component system response regulator [Pirellulaceae bacterium]|nr:MAG: two-component system response regulator [Pirellulaceae bacterium]